MLLDVRTGKRTQVTDLVTPTCRPTVGSLEVFYPLFVDERTIRFSRNVAKSDTDPCELGKDNYVIEQCTVRTNGSRLRCTPTPIFNGLPIQTGEPELAIQGKHVSLVTVDVAPAEGARQAITEIFAKRGRQISQLTHLGSSDTRPRSLTRNERLVLFTTAANPFGTNPGNRCELFSMNIRGGGMKQVTNFNHDPAIPADQIKNGKGCSTGGDFGCTIGKVLLDPRTKALVFMSNCDLLGTGVSGEQAFAMWPDGSGLTQITHAAGCRGVCKVDPLTTLPTSVELPGYMSYAPVPPRKRR
jgi:hypothetical protein